jgi:hypothetical protein
VPECVLCWACRGRTYHGKVERSAHGCVLAGVLRSNSPRRGQMQRAECGRTYISKFEHRDPKSAKKTIQEKKLKIYTKMTKHAIKQDFYNKNEQNIYTNTKQNIYTNKIKYLHKHQIKYLQTLNKTKNIYKH